MSDILHKLLSSKAKALKSERERESMESLAERAQAQRAQRRSLRAALECSHGPAVIAEIKRASPSRGLIARSFDPAAIARGYADAGVDAISVLTEADHFLGDLAYLAVARAQAPVPILRKDFLTDAYQVVQSAAYGADAILLIAAILDDATLRTLLAEAAKWNLEALVEVHDEGELTRANAAGATLIGVNNRDLRTFETDLSVTEHLLEFAAPGAFIVSESGVGNPADAHRLFRKGARAFLIGESLMRSEDPRAFVRAIKDTVPVSL